jgi:hypothetical protein
VQDERQPLRRGERVEHHEQRQPDGVRQHRFALGVEGVGLVADERLGQAAAGVVLAAGAAGAQHVQRHARHHRRQPAGQVDDRLGVGPVEPQPGLLHGIVGVADRAQHPVRHGAQARAVALELRGQQVSLVHHPDDVRRPADVTVTSPPRRSTKA